MPRCIVLVGDIVDALSMARRFFWSPEHTQIVRTLLARQRAGTRLIYIPGNHDASLGVMAEMLQGQLEVHREWVHRTARGERLLVMHGDQFDGVVSCAPWLTRLGDTMYDVVVMLSHSVNNLLRAMKRRTGRWPSASSSASPSASATSRSSRTLPRLTPGSRATTAWSAATSTART